MWLNHQWSRINVTLISDWFPSPATPLVVADESLCHHFSLLQSSRLLHEICHTHDAVLSPSTCRHVYACVFVSVGLSSRHTLYQCVCVCALTIVVLLLRLSALTNLSVSLSQSSTQDTFVSLQPICVF